LATAAASRYLSGLLVGVRPLDPVSFVLVTMALVIVTMVASLVPARRATHVDPLVALRCE
jgi:ABC-type lipoprotein release transport system permease subunit